MSGYFQKNISKGSKVVIISANDKSGPFTIRLYLNNGETASSRKPKTAKTLANAIKAADKFFAL